MDTTEILTDAFGRIRDWVHSAVDGLPAAALNYRPDPASNSIGWLIWHLTRVQDDHIAHLARATQAYTRDGWAERLGLNADDGDIGYGHTPEQVAAVRFDAGDDLVAYFDAVHQATLEYIATVTPEELSRIVDTRWDPPVTAGVRLVSVMDDCMNHTGQAHYVRGLWERLTAADTP